MGGELCLRRNLLKMRALLLSLFLTVCSVAWGFSNCRCALMTTFGMGEYIVSELPGIDMGSCTDSTGCEARCYDEYDNMTYGGDLYHMMDDLETVGQHLCKFYEHDMHNQYLYAYSKLCEGPWVYTGHHSLQMLCCWQGRQYACS
ncbi:uncharacterized protein LOC143020041 [Oratosquilla oratoria]|uniref:uncharacterized protein LOC143018435 n=1 Tax=Oratosquilla oratoria TaxID=337810 RepID=UPI003F776043